MVTLVLDGHEVQTMDEIHDLFAKTFEFPEYYGRNLDALSDCLEDIGDDFCVIIRNKEELEDTLGKAKDAFFSMMQDVYEENPYFDLLIEGVEDHGGIQE